MSRRWVGAALVGVMVLATVVLWDALPDRIPSHWNLSGEVDGWSPKWPGAFIAPGIGLAVWLLLPFLRRLDPRRENYERFESTFHLMVNVIVGYLAVIHGLVMAASLGWPVDVARVIVMLIGVTFVAIGNVLPRVRSNWWMGIRTPWTLESERVWRETHRMAGRTFVIGGAVAVAAALLLPEPYRGPVAITALMAGGLIPAVWSYVLWRRHGPEESEV